MPFRSTAVLGACLLLGACMGDPDVVGSLNSVGVSDAGTMPEPDAHDAGFTFEPPPSPWFERDAAPPPQPTMNDTGGGQPTPPVPDAGCDPDQALLAAVPSWAQLARDQNCMIQASFLTSGVDWAEFWLVWGYIYASQGPFPPGEDCGPDYPNFGFVVDPTTGNIRFCQAACDALKEYVAMRNAAVICPDRSNPVPNPGMP